MRTLILLLLLANAGAFYYWQYYAPPQPSQDPAQVLPFPADAVRLSMLDEAAVEPPMMLASREDNVAATDDIGHTEGVEAPMSDGNDEKTMSMVTTTSPAAIAEVDAETATATPEKSARFFEKVATLTSNAGEALDAWRPSATTTADIVAAVEPETTEVSTPQETSPATVLSAASLSQPVLPEAETAESAPATIEAEPAMTPDTMVTATSPEIETVPEGEAASTDDETPVIVIAAIEPEVATESDAAVEIVPLPAEDLETSEARGADDTGAEETAPTKSIQAIPSTLAPAEETLATISKAICYRTGIYPKESDAKIAARWFENRGVLTHLVSNNRRTKTATRVYLPPFASRAAAQLANNVLAQRGVQDRQIVTSGNLNNAISLGLYQNEESLQRRLAELRAKGYYNVKTEARYKTDGRFLVELKMAEEKMPLIETFKNNFKVVLPQQVACKEIAIRKEIP